MKQTIHDIVNTKGNLLFKKWLPIIVILLLWAVFSFYNHGQSTVPSINRSLYYLVEKHFEKNIPIEKATMYFSRLGSDSKGIHDITALPTYLSFIGINVYYLIATKLLIIFIPDLYAPYYANVALQYIYYLFYLGFLIFFYCVLMKETDAYTAFLATTVIMAAWPLIALYKSYHHIHFHNIVLSFAFVYFFSKLQIEIKKRYVLLLLLTSIPILTDSNRISMVVILYPIMSIALFRTIRHLKLVGITITVMLSIKLITKKIFYYILNLPIVVDTYTSDVLKNTLWNTITLPLHPRLLLKTIIEGILYYYDIFFVHGVQSVWSELNWFLGEPYFHILLLPFFTLGLINLFMNKGLMENTFVKNIAMFCLFEWLLLTVAIKLEKYYYGLIPYVAFFIALGINFNINLLQQAIEKSTFSINIKKHGRLFLNVCVILFVLGLIINNFYRYFYVGPKYCYSYYRHTGTCTEANFLKLTKFILDKYTVYGNYKLYVGVGAFGIDNFHMSMAFMLGDNLKFISYYKYIKYDGHCSTQTGYNTIDKDILVDIERLMKDGNSGFMIVTKIDNRGLYDPIICNGVPAVNVEQQFYKSVDFLYNKYIGKLKREFINYDNKPLWAIYHNL